MIKADRLDYASDEIPDLKGKSIVNEFKNTNFIERFKHRSANMNKSRQRRMFSSSTHTHKVSWH